MAAAKQHVRLLLLQARIHKLEHKISDLDMQQQYWEDVVAGKQSALKLLPVSYALC